MADVYILESIPGYAFLNRRLHDHLGCWSEQQSALQCMWRCIEDYDPEDELTMGSIFYTITTLPIDAPQQDGKHSIQYFDYLGNPIIPGWAGYDPDTPPPSEKDWEALRIGDFVEILPFPWGDGEPVDSMIGVLRDKEDPEWWSAYFINERGYLDHNHMDRRSYRAYRGEIPEELRFLRNLQEEVHLWEGGHQNPGPILPKAAERIADMEICVKPCACLEGFCEVVLWQNVEANENITSENRHSRRKTSSNE